MTKGIVISHTFYKGIKEVDYVFIVFPECLEEPYRKGKVTDGEGNTLAYLTVRDRAITIEEATWDKVSEYESMDVVLQWANIQGRPTSTPAELDDAVAKVHVHANKLTIDKITEVNGDLMFDGKNVDPVLRATDW